MTIPIGPGDPVSITNDTDADLSFSWAKRQYRIRAHQSALVPFELVVLNFGDPRSQTDAQKIEHKDSGKIDFIPSRSSELHRISVLWGCYEDNLASLPSIIPQVSIKTSEGAELIPIAFDPTGERVASTEQADLMDPVQLRSYLTQQRQRIQALEDQLDIRTRTDIEQVEDITEDVPVTASRRRAS
ncbi:MAG: hypothetical protein ACREBW_06505 [Candidatus Micrarchaeaceae archaeon]